MHTYQREDIPERLRRLLTLLEGLANHRVDSQVLLFLSVLPIPHELGEEVLRHRASLRARALSHKLLAEPVL